MELSNRLATAQLTLGGEGTGAAAAGGDSGGQRGGRGGGRGRGGWQHGNQDRSAEEARA